ncbi:MAG: flippase-like domain-containing protein [Clostridia bacterium]|nr:flippase-like domain-containing protein [Clostridia bacterium]
MGKNFIETNENEIKNPEEQKNCSTLCKNCECDLTHEEHIERHKRAAKKAKGYKTRGTEGVQEDNVGKRQKIFKRITVAVFIVFVVGVLAFTAYNDFSPGEGKEFASPDAINAIFSKGWYFLVCALLSLCVQYSCKGLKIAIMCKSMTGRFHIKTSMETGIIGTYYNNVTPLAVGGQPFEIYHLSKHGVHGGVASSVPIATFFLNQLAFVILGIFSLVFINANTFNIPTELISPLINVFNVLGIIGLVCCLFMPSMVIIFSLLPRVGAKLVRFVMKIGAKFRVVKNAEETTAKTITNVQHNAKCIRKIATSPVVFFSTFLLSFVENLAGSSIAFFVLKAFGYDLVGVPTFIEWVQIVQIVTLLYASITFIPTPGNAGAADLSFYVLFSTGITLSGLAFPAMLTWRIFSFYSTIIIGFVFTTLKKRSDKRKIALGISLEDIIEE